MSRDGDRSSVDGHEADWVPALDAGGRPWVGYCVECGQERWMTAATMGDPCGLCQLASARSGGL